MQNMEQQNDRISFLKGMRDGVPIALGYFAVAFTLGITAGKGRDECPAVFPDVCVDARIGGGVCGDQHDRIRSRGYGDDRYYSGHQYALPADVKCFIPEGAARTGHFSTESSCLMR